MAKEDAAVAIQNALHKLDQQPVLLHNDERFKSVKSNLQLFSSRLNRFGSIAKLTEVREIAYDVEDVVDDAIVLADEGARQRWRKLRKLLLFFLHKINHQRGTEEQIDRSRDSGSNTPGSQGSDDEVVELEKKPRSIFESGPPQQDLFDLFYLSLSGFPAEVEILARRLIQIWVADGLLCGSKGWTAMEEGREPMGWLVARGFIKPVQTGTCGNLKTFKIESNTLEACRSAAKEADFLHASAGEDEETSINAVRLAIHLQSTTQLTGNNLPWYRVRSLQIHCNEANNHNRLSDGAFLKKLKNVRVLDLGGLELEVVPEAIGKLMYLRYLRLRAPKATKIPDSIWNIRNLQAIDLKETECLKPLSIEIWKNKSLRHLDLGGATTLPVPPPRSSNNYYPLEQLHTLCGVRPDKNLKRLMIMAKFPNVTRLRLQCTSNQDSEDFVSFLNSIDLLYHLRSLTLIGPIEDLPRDLNAFPSSLMKMTLSRTRIPADKCVGTLQSLPSLRYLKLMEESVAGERMECATGGFPALQKLRMEGLKDLQRWIVEKGAMRLLNYLEVRGCEKLTRVDAFQPSKEFIETLQELQYVHGSCNIYHHI